MDGKTTRELQTSYEGTGKHLKSSKTNGTVDIMSDNRRYLEKKN